MRSEFKSFTVGVVLSLAPGIPTAMSQPITREDFIVLRNEIRENFYWQNERIKRVEREIDYGRREDRSYPPLRRRIVHVHRYYEYYWCPPPPPWWW
jgi:hypothetical protein